MPHLFSSYFWTFKTLNPPYIITKNFIIPEYILNIFIIMKKESAQDDTEEFDPFDV